MATGFSAAGLDDQYMLVYDYFPPLNTDGLESIEKRLISTYPNPVKYNHNVTFELPGETVNWQITDLHGRVVKSFQTTQHQVSLRASFSPGYYFINGRSKNFHYQSKLLILE